MHKFIFQRCLTHPKATFYIVILGIILTLPALFSGLFADDFVHFGLINNGSNIVQPNNLSLFDLFTFIDNSPERRLQLFGLGLTPWWVSEKFSLIFFRPLSEITHYIDYHFFKTNALLSHLHSLLWYSLLLIALNKFYRLFTITPVIAALSLLLFVSDATHGFTLAWLANRNAIIAACFTLFAVLQHHQFRTGNGYQHFFLSLICIICSFLAAETGIAVGIFLFAYALYLDKSPFYKAALYLLPALAIFLLWLYLYKFYGYGAFGNRAYYIDPIESTSLFLHNLPARLCQTLAMQFNFLPIHLIKPFPILMTLLGMFYFTLLAVGAFLKAGKHYLFFLTCLLLTIIPITSSELQDRNLIFVGIAACPLLAQFMYWLYNKSATITAILLLNLIIIFHIYLSGLLMLPTTYAPHWLAKSSIATAKSLPSNIKNKHLITFGTPLFDFVYTTAIRYYFELPLPAHLWNVSTNPHQLTITKITDYQYQIKNSNGLLWGDDFLLRNWTFDPIAIGTIFHLNQLDIMIKQLNADGTPTEATIDVDKTIPLHDIQLWYWQYQQLLPLHLKQGESFLLP